MRRIIAGILTGVICVGGIYLQGEAANLRINYSKIRLLLAPGEAKSGSITVDNTSDETVNVKAYLEDWIYTPLCDGTKKFFPSGSQPLSASSWISFSPSQFSLPPFGKQTVNYQVKVSEEAQGGYYAVLFFESVFGEQGNSSQDSVGMSLLVRIGTLFYIESAGTVQPAAVIQNVSTEKKDDAFEIRADFKNTGNVDITAAGTFHIMNDQGLVVSRGEFNKIFTFPGDSCSIAASSKAIPLQGSYFLVITLDLGKAKEELNMGRGPVITKEFSLEISSAGRVTAIKDLN